nr:hypothetical protein [Tanacetum cinerariifolium]
VTTSVTTWDDLVEKFVKKFYQLSDHNEKDNNPNDIADIFKIEGNLFDFETPLCESFNDFNYLLKIDKDLFTFDIQRTGTYEVYELNNHVARDLEEPSDIDEFCNGGELPGMVRVGSMTYFQDHKLYGNIANGMIKEETLIHKVKIEESWGNATPVNLLQVKIGDPNIIMKEYIRLEEKTRRCGKVYNWETNTYGKIWYDEDVYDLRSVETKFPAIVFNDSLTSEVTLTCEPTTVYTAYPNPMDKAY